MEKRAKKLSKKAMELEILAWIILCLAVLVIVFIAISYFSKSSNSAIDFIKNLFRFNK
jgi:uncharacterized membrane protein affecting hemolysin expression